MPMDSSYDMPMDMGSYSSGGYHGEGGSGSQQSDHQQPGSHDGVSG